jgi:signal transduction histidine kinase
MRSRTLGALILMAASLSAWAQIPGPLGYSVATPRPISPAEGTTTPSAQATQLTVSPAVSNPGIPSLRPSSSWCLRRCTSDQERALFATFLLTGFGRMEARTSPYRLEPLDGCAFVRSVVEEFEAEAAGRGYHVELDVNGARGVIAGDRAALGNALWNLLDNAVKYSLECRTVWVDVERKDRRLAIRVRDRGLGIPAGEGTGLGRVRAPFEWK